MKDVKQFLSTGAGKIVAVVVILGIGIFIGTHGSSKSAPIESPQTADASPVTAPSAVTPPAPVSVTVKSTPVQTTQKKAVIPTPAPVVTPPVQNPIPPPPPAPTPAPALTWHTVYTVSAETTKQTPPFSIKGSQWRVTWNCAYGNPTTPTIDAYSTSGSVSSTVASPDTCPASDTTYFYNGPGTFYFRISTYSDASISATVEDYY